MELVIFKGKTKRKRAKMRKNGILITVKLHNPKFYRLANPKHKIRAKQHSEDFMYTKHSP